MAFGIGRSLKKLGRKVDKETRRVARQVGDETVNALRIVADPTSVLAQDEPEMAPDPDPIPEVGYSDNSASAEATARASLEDEETFGLSDTRRKKKTLGTSIALS